MQAGYLGPRGTFTEQAAKIMTGGQDIIPFKSFWEALEAVECGKIQEAVVPIENSIEGVVNASMDCLIFDVELYIQELLIMPIEQNLIAKKGTNISGIKKIYSHSHAIPQCKKFIRENIPGAQLQSVSSTADGIRLAANAADDECIAAIGSLAGAELYGLEVLAKSIQDTNSNFTQFARVSKQPSAEIKNNSKATICFSTENRPGTLYRMLEIFSIFDANMSKISSRPMRDRPMEYVFIIDLDIYDNSEDIKSALSLLQRKTSFFKNLGVYNVIDLRSS